MVPPDTFLLWRWKDLAAYEAHETPTVVGGGGAPVPAAATLGAELNLPGLPGIDRSRPLLEATLPAERRPDPRFWVLPVSDAAAVRARFRDPNLAERHARHVVTVGDWAAVAWDLDAARRAGTDGGPWPKERGEEWCVHAEWPEFVSHVLRPEQAMQQPFLGILATLGFVPKGDPAPDGAVAFDAGRTLLVRDAWATATLWAFPERIRAELVPAAGSDLVAALAAAVPDPPDAALPSVPAPKAEARLRARGAQGRRVLAYALVYAGVAWPQAAGKDGFAAMRLDSPGGVEAWAEPAEAKGLPHWTVGWAGPGAALPDPAAFGLPAPEAGADAEVAEGLAALTAPYGGTAPRGAIARRAWTASGRAGTEVVALGIDARNLADRASASEPDALHSAWPEAPKPDAEGGRSVLLATFRLTQAAAVRILGRAVSANGLLSPLRQGDVEGTLSTDGVRLIVEARRVAKP
jgi:hypothetical protein